MYRLNFNFTIILAATTAIIIYSLHTAYKISIPLKYFDWPNTVALYRH